MELNQKNTFLETAKPGALIKKYSLPCVISLLVAALYNIADQIFIANADYLGAVGNAANTVVYPMTVIALALAVMIGDGGCTFISISLGSKNSERAGRCAGNAIALSLVSGVALAALYFAFREPILVAFGGKVNGETFALSKEYFTWISAGIPLYVFGQAMNPLIRADGSPRFAMISTLSGAAVNIVLDPLFIYVFKWGMTGAAVATVAGQALTAVLAAVYLAKAKNIRPTMASLKPSFRITCRFLSLGLTSFLAQISLVAAMAAIQNMILKYGALDAVFGQEEYAHIPMAVLGIVMKFFQIVISAVIGMAAGCIPVVGYNMGAGRRDRVKKLMTRLLGWEVAIGALALFAAEVLPRQLIIIFGAAGESVYYTDFAVKSFRVYLCMVIFACVNKAAFIFLQAMGKALPSTALSMVRELVFGVGFALLLPRFFGVDGVLYSMPLSDILTFIMSCAVLVSVYRELSGKRSKAAE